MKSCMSLPEFNFFSMFTVKIILKCCYLSFIGPVITTIDQI